MNTKPFISVILLAFLVSVGCETQQENTGFKRTVTFSDYATFAVKEPLMVGFLQNSADSITLEGMTHDIVVEELEARGFVAADASEADMVVVPRWRKRNETPSPEPGFDGPGIDTIGVNDSIVFSVEVVEQRSGKSFWSSTLPPAAQFSIVNIRMAENAIRDVLSEFPDRIEKDPNLPDIE